MVSYFFKFAAGAFHQGMNAESSGSVFTTLLSNPLEMGIWMAVVVLAGFLVCSRGLQNGLERISKGMMSALLILIVVLPSTALPCQAPGKA